jgi:hypothetical protein
VIRRKPAGRPRVLDAGLDEYAIDALLLNWAAWAGGRAASVGYGRNGAVPLSAPNEDAARAMEVILCRMKATRPRLFRVVRYRYISRLTDETIARSMSRRGHRESRDTVRALVRRAYSWIDGHLESLRLR